MNINIWRFASDTSSIVQGDNQSWYPRWIMMISDDNYLGNPWKSWEHVVSMCPKLLNITGYYWTPQVDDDLRKKLLAISSRRSVGHHAASTGLFWWLVSSLLCGSKMEDIRVAEWFLVRVLCEGSTSMVLTLVALYAWVGAKSNCCRLVWRRWYTNLFEIHKRPPL